MTDAKTSDALEQAVANILNKALQAAETAGEFVVEQLPDVARQYVLYMGVWHTVKAALFFALLATAIVLYRKGVKWDMSQPDSNERGAFTALVGFFGGIGCLAVLFTGFIPSVHVAIMAFIAPKVLLIKWAAVLIK